MTWPIKFCVSNTCMEQSLNAIAANDSVRMHCKSIRCSSHVLL